MIRTLGRGEEVSKVVEKESYVLIQRMCDFGGVRQV